MMPADRVSTNVFPLAESLSATVSREKYYSIIRLTNLIYLHLDASIINGQLVTLEKNAFFKRPCSQC